MAGTGSLMRLARRGALRRVGLAVSLPLLAPALGACAVSRASRGFPGTDLSEVRGGRTRAQIEAVLGAPLREWSTPAGVRYRMYRYDAGQPGNRDTAAAILFFDLISLGLVEVFVATGVEDFDDPPERRMRNLAVSYGPDEVAIGVFEDVTEFERLPEDGMAPARKPADAAR